MCFLGLQVIAFFPDEVDILEYDPLMIDFGASGMAFWGWSFLTWCYLMALVDRNLSK